MVTVVLLSSVFWHTVAGCCAHHHHETASWGDSKGHEPAAASCSRGDASRQAGHGYRVAPSGVNQGSEGDLASRASAAEDSLPACLRGQGFRTCREGSCSFAGAPTVRIKTSNEPRRPWDPAVDAVCRCSLIGAFGTVPAQETRGVLGRWFSAPFLGIPLRTHLVLRVLTL